MALKTNSPNCPVVHVFINTQHICKKFWLYDYIHQNKCLATEIWEAPVICTYAYNLCFSCSILRVKYTRYKIFIAMQPFKVEMTQDNYTTLQNTKQHKLYYSHSHSGNFSKNTCTNNTNSNRPNLKQCKISLICYMGWSWNLVRNENSCLVEVGMDMWAVKMSQLNKFSRVLKTTKT